MIGPPLVRSVVDQVFQVLLFFSSLVPMLVEGGGVPVPEGLRPWVPWGNVLFAALLAEEEFRRFRIARDRVSLLREEVVDYVLLGLVTLLALEELATGGALFGMVGSEAVIAPSKGYILVNLVLRVVRLFRLVAGARISYPKVFLSSFVIVIVVGALVLWGFPGSVRPGKQVGFVDALFTSASATCVTGLSTVPVYETFSRFGQTVILILIQIGGLGLMTFAAFFAVALGKGVGFTDRVVLQDLLNVDPAATIGRMLAGLVSLTFTVEATGAALMFGRFTDPVSGTLLPAEDQLYFATFHSVSAFCNAGFSLYDARNWTVFATDPLMNGVVASEIVLGGLGFTVILNGIGLLRDPIHRLRERLRRRPLTEAEEEAEERREPPRMSLQTRLALRVSAVLVAGGAVLFLILEWDNVLAGRDTTQAVMASLFQSVTCRTAGFNTVDIDKLRASTLCVMIVLMFIGASPGGTGGGIKTVTAAVLSRVVASLARGRSRVEVFHRTLPDIVAAQAIVVTTLSLAAAAGATIVLCVTEPRLFQPGGTPSGDPFLAVLFEVVSALGTVGLSTGITDRLTDAGKLVLVAVMFVGRVGPITLTQAVAAKRPGAYEWPEERVMIG
jgi:trk system potassium uptake protein TrkH